MSDRSERAAVQLPPVTFFYTLDQVASMLNMSQENLKREYLYYHLRTTGMKLAHQMVALNIAGENMRPDWRVEMKEFVRWCRSRGVRIEEIPF